jgi:hypothetical protein
MIKLKNLIIESVSIKELVQYYMRRVEELKSHYKIEGSTGEFQFDIYQKSLGIMCDVIHSDTITNSAEMIDQNSFYFPNSMVNSEKKYTMEPFNFQINDFVGDIIYALNKIGIKATHGMSQHGNFLRVSQNLPGHVSVNSYTGDTLTVQLDIENINQLLVSNPEIVTKTIDVFIVKMFDVIKVIKTEIFPPNNEKREKY